MGIELRTSGIEGLALTNMNYARETFGRVLFSLPLYKSKTNFHGRHSSETTTSKRMVSLQIFERFHVISMIDNSMDHGNLLVLYNNIKSL